MFDPDLRPDNKPENGSPSSTLPPASLVVACVSFALLLVFASFDFPVATQTAAAVGVLATIVTVLHFWSVHDPLDLP